MTEATLEEIYHFLWCTPELASAGQTRAADYPSVAQAGFEAMNNGVPDAEYALLNEPG